jgi:HlyD family secretion protein
VEVVVSADNAPFLIGQRVLVKFMKPGQKAGRGPPASLGASNSRSSG